MYISLQKYFIHIIFTFSELTIFILISLLIHFFIPPHIYSHFFDIWAL